MSRLKNKQNFYSIFFIVILFCIFQYSIFRLYGFTIYQDEYGYWSNAASFLGLNWKGVTSVVPYYSFGYSLVLIPILALVESSVSAYRIAIALNFTLLIGSFFLIKKFFRNVFYNNRIYPIVIMCGLLTPTTIVYLQTTLSEIFLTFSFIGVCYFFSEMLKHTSNNKYSIALGILTGFLFWIHMRSIGIIAALMFTLLIQSIKDSETKKNNLKIVLITFFMLLLGLIIKEFIIYKFYPFNSSNLIAANDFEGQFNKLQILFTVNGIYKLAQSCIAKALYITIATAGTAIWGFIYSNRKSIDYFKINRSEKSDLIYVFLTFVFILEFCINALAMIDGKRYDHLFYGRYLEFIIPIYIVLGIQYMLEMKSVVLNSILMICGTVTLSILTVFLSGNRIFDRVVGYFIIGISYFLDEKNFELKAFVFKTCILGIILICFMILFILIVRKYRNGIMVFFLLLVVEIFAGFRVSERYNYAFNIAQSTDISLLDNIDMEIISKRDFYYVYENKEPVITTLQFFYRHKEIKVISQEDIDEYLTEDNLIILDSKSELINIASKVYKNKVRISGLILFY